jgi:hypothetical protein
MIIILFKIEYAPKSMINWHEFQGSAPTNRSTQRSRKPWAINQPLTE